MTETLDQTLAIKAEEWTQADLTTIIEGLRTQRERWNVEQAKGSRKVVKTKAIPTKPATPKKKTIADKAAKLRGIVL